VEINMTVATTSSFYVERVHEVTVLCFTVRCLIEENYEEVSEELLEFVESVSADRPIRIVAELTSIGRIDGLGLAMLEALIDSIADAGGRLILCRVQSGVMTAIRRTGMRCEFSKTRSGAIGSF
jgi:anti-anti-sigma regulatory factor